MSTRSDFEQMPSAVEQLGRLAQELYDSSAGFPAINRNTKRILASVEMLRINLGDVVGIEDPVPSKK
ncbi:MAG: hypothetical protein WBG50_07210 [Desulfomonilaceae bacterium]